MLSGTARIKGPKGLRDGGLSRNAISVDYLKLQPRRKTSPESEVIVWLLRLMMESQHCIYAWRDRALV